MSMPWYGELPERWEAQRIKNLFALRDERNFEPLSEVRLLSLYTAIGVKPHNEIERTTGNRAITADNYKKVYTNDIVVNIILCWQGAIGLSRHDGVTSPAYDVYRAMSDNVNVDYFNYLFRMPLFSGECYKAGRGIMAMRWRTYSDQFTAITVPLPPRDEQDQIVRYLDWKVSQINKLIGAKRRQIALLGEQKRAGINEVVTRGGENWRKSCIKREFINLDYMRRPIEASERSQKGEILYDYYGASGVVDKIDNYIFDQTTLLIAEDGANLVLRNLPLIYIARGKYWVNNHAHILVPKEHNDLMFMAYLLESIDYTVYITGAAQPKLSQDNLGRVSLSVPPLTEQQEISAYLDAQCTRIDKVIEDLNEEIVLFAEYRTRLISDVVTGKLDVRGIAVPEFEAVEDVAEVEGETTEGAEESIDI